MKKLKRFDREADFNSTTYPTVGYMNDATGNRARYHSKPTKNYSKTDYFTTTALEDCVFRFQLPPAINTNHVSWISYSTDNGVTWVKTNNSSSNIFITTPTITTGNKVLWKGSGKRLATGTNMVDHPTIPRQSCWISSTGDFDVSGNIMSLLYADDYQDKKSLDFMYCFSYLFCEIAYHENTHLKDASCLNLPATKLAQSCYLGMFQNCTSLTAVPELPAVDLQPYCYAGLFRGCTSLTSAPALPATILKIYCYQNMFYGCTSLTSAPALPATLLVEGCYYSMFYNCSNLNYIKAMFTTTPVASQIGGWVYGVASSGTFVKNSAATWNVTGPNGIPSDWTVQIASS